MDWPTDPRVMRTLVVLTHEPEIGSLDDGRLYAFLQQAGGGWAAWELEDAEVQELYRRQWLEDAGDAPAAPAGI